MITKLFHQLWNERKQNAWLFLELIVASLFLWFALDPLYTLICRRYIPSGFDASDTYMVEIAQYRPGETKYKVDPELFNNSAVRECCTQAINIIRSMPEVEYHTTADPGSMVNSYSTSSTTFTTDSIDYTLMQKSFEEVEEYLKSRKLVSIIYWRYILTEGSNYPATFGIRDIHTGDYLKNDIAQYPNGVFISESAAMQLFGTTDAKGKEFRYVYKDKLLRVAGVFKDIQMVQYDEPSPLMIMSIEAIDDMYANSHNGTTVFLHIRLKKGVDKDEFEKRFREEIMPKLEIGNVYCSNITSHDNIRKKYSRRFGIDNMYRLYVGLSSFALFCAFLGLLSSFWIRTAERRADIGIMRSVGASRSKIVSQFAGEALLLATLAFIVAMPFVMHYLHVEGFADPIKDLFLINKESSNPAYLHNQPLTHFVTVTIVGYLFMAIVAVVGAVIPAWRATRIEPADAMRE